MNIGDTVWYEDLAGPFGYLSARLISRDEKTACLFKMRNSCCGGPPDQPHIFFVPAETIRPDEPPEQTEWLRQWNSKTF